VRDATSLSAQGTAASRDSGDEAAPDDASGTATTTTGNAQGDDSAASGATDAHGAPNAGGATDAEAAADADAGVALPPGCIANLATAGFALGKGSFLCLKDGGSYANLASHSDVYCDRATEFCFISGGGPAEDGCHPLSCSKWLTVEAGACSGGPLRCACLSGASCGYYFNFCDDDDAGGITVSCGSCYGAPPARLSA
jgi:hypothetical protein